MTQTIFKIAKRVAVVILVAFVAVVIYRIPHVAEQKKTDEAVAKIHATKLTLDDVMGKNLPVDFVGDAVARQKYYDSTIEGVDINKNGIRDDVELAIFKAYPNSARTRAVLLQYALALQMEMTQSVVNTETVIAVAQESSRAALCIGDSVSRKDMQKFIQVTQQLNNFVEKIQINNDQRNIAEKVFFKKIGSYADLSVGECDLDLSKLLN